RAPLTTTGPVSGCTAPASMLAMPDAVTEGPSCPSTPSRVSSTTSSPSLTSRIGGTSGCQRLCPVLGCSIRRLPRSISTLFMDAPRSLELRGDLHPVVRLHRIIGPSRGAAQPDLEPRGVEDADGFSLMKGDISRASLQAEIVGGVDPRPE